MKSKLYKTAVVLLLLAILVSVCIFGWPHYVERAARRALHSVSRNAAEITSVEVLRIRDDSGASGKDTYRLNYGGRSYTVNARHTLTGDAAAELVRTWGRVRSITGINAGCHSPDFALRFLARDRSVFEVAVCFDCEIILYNPTPFESESIQMAPTKWDPKSGIDDLKALLAEFE